MTSRSVERRALLQDLRRRLAVRDWAVEWFCLVAAPIAFWAAATTTTVPSVERARIDALLRDGEVTTATIRAIRPVALTDHAGELMVGQRTIAYQLDVAFIDHHKRRQEISGLLVRRPEAQALGLLADPPRRTLTLRYRLPDVLVAEAVDVEAQLRATGPSDLVCVPASLCGNVVVSELVGPGASDAVAVIHRLALSLSALFVGLVLARLLGVLKPRPRV